MAICKNKHCSTGECNYTDVCAAYVPLITNADRIRAMSDEELAKWILQFVIDCTEPTLGEDCSFEDGSEAVMVEWLKQPAEEK